MKRCILILVFASVVILSSGIFLYPVKAQISACSLNTNPSSVEENQSFYEFSFSLANGDSANTIRWMKLDRPFSSILIRGSSMGGWVRSESESSVIFTGGTVNPSASASFGIIADTTTAGSGNWNLQVSNDTGGANPTSCTGSIGLTISATADTTPPSISGISVSGVSSSSVLISWTTNESATSKVKYNVNANQDDYPFSHNDTNLVTSHAVTVTNSVAANTTYYYRVCSTDTASNESCSTEGSFTTAPLGATAAPTRAVAPTSAASSITPTPNPTPPPVDRTAPRVSITTELEKSYKEAPLIEGSANDNNKVSSVEYSTDGGDNWLPVDESEGLGTVAVKFSVTPYIFEDGNYNIVVRAIDGNANIGKSETLVVVIDLLPPRVGGNYMAFGPQPLLPNEDGIVVTMVGVEQKITLSAVGGPTKIEIYIGDEPVTLTQSVDTGLWSGYLVFDKAGVYNLKSIAVDGAGNEVKKDLNRVLVVEPGLVKNKSTEKIIGKGTIEVFVKDSLTNIWARWDGKTFSQENPQKITKDGYEYFLPAGTYYLQINSPGYELLISKIFTLKESTILNSDFYLGEKKGINLGFFKIPLPSLLTDKVPIVLKSKNIPNTESQLLGEKIGNFEFDTTKGDTFDSDNLRGTNTVLTFISTWAPTSVEQLSLLDKEISEKAIDGVIISGLESVSRVSIFQKRGRYQSDIVVDIYGELFNRLNINTLPTHVFINKQGVIEKIATGVLNGAEVESAIDEIR